MNLGFTNLFRMYSNIYELLQIINMYGELIMDAVPEKVRVFVIMQMYLMRDWEGRANH